MNDFDENNDNQNWLTNKQRFYFVLSYIPFLSFILFFKEINPKPKDLDKFKIQWLAIFVLFTITYFVLSIIWLWKMLFFIYIFFSIFMWFNAYNWKYIEISFIEKIIKNFKN